MENKTKEQLFKHIQEQEAVIKTLELELDKEREQVKAIIDDVMPIVDEIQSSNKFLRFVKIVKLAIALCEKLSQFIKSRSK